MPRSGAPAAAVVAPARGRGPSKRRGGVVGEMARRKKFRKGVAIVGEGRIMRPLSPAHVAGAVL